MCLICEQGNIFMVLLYIQIWRGNLVISQSIYSQFDERCFYISSLLNNNNIQIYFGRYWEGWKGSLSDCFELILLWYGVCYNIIGYYLF